MYEQTAIEYLQEKYPGAFEGWDGFEICIQTRKREGDQPLMLVTLHNKGTEGFIVDLHTCFLMTWDEEGQDVIRVGRHELAQEYSSAYIPEQYRRDTDLQPDPGK